MMEWRLGKAAMWPVLAVIAAGLGLSVGAQELERKVTRAYVNLPGGPVRQVILTNCSACHGIDDYAYHALDRAGWQALIENMCVSSGAVIPDKDRDILLDYLVATFGPDSTPFPRDYVPVPISSTFSDEDARTFLDQNCTSCHELDQVFGPRHREPRWRSIVLDMRERGARLTDEEVERLVEWLYRVWGVDR